jgi:hypothetical protein
VTEPAPQSVFVLTVQAVAGPANSQPDGLGYAILAFVRGDSEASATDAALAGLASLGWIEPQILRAGEITDPEAAPPDLQPPIARALRDGCALVIYDQP